jgi:hypothetical protein
MRNKYIEKLKRATKNICEIWEGLVLTVHSHWLIAIYFGDGAFKVEFLIWPGG